MASVTRVLADSAVTSAKILDGTVAVADLASAVGNFGAWTAYTPTWTGNTTNPALGNGTIVGAYAQIGKVVNFRILLTMGSTTTFGTGFYSFGVPVTAAAGATGSYTTVGSVVALDNSTTLIYEANPCLLTTTTVILRYQTGGLFSNVAPVTFATSDIITIQGTYQAA